MTGPRTGSCNTCRKRKVKCDESRPACKRCIDSGIKCKGYQLPVQFIIEDGSQGRKRRETSPKKPPSHQSLVQQSQRRFQNDPPAWLSLEGFSQELFVPFLLDRMRHDLAPAKNHLTFFAKESFDRQSTSSMALDALATMFFARTRGELGQLQQATSKYGKALTQFRTNISRGDALSMDSLRAATAFMFFELIALTGTDAWLQHAGGLAKLVFLNGPDVYKAEYRDLFIQIRTLLISKALIYRQRTFLSEPAWKDVPWEDSPASKSDTDYLFDVIGDVSGILEDVDLICEGQNTPEDFEILSKDLRRRIWKAFRDLNAWWREWMPQIVSKYSRIAVDRHSTLCIDGEGPVIEHRLEFDCFWTCYLFMSYNAVRILLLDACEQISVTFGQDRAPDIPPGEANSTKLAGISNNGATLATEIVQCVDYCVSQSKHSIGIFCLVFPLFIAGDHFRHETRMVDWFFDVCRFDDLPVLSGFVSKNRRVAIMSRSQVESMNNTLRPVATRAELHACGWRQSSGRKQDDVLLRIC